MEVEMEVLETNPPEHQHSIMLDIITKNDTVKVKCCDQSSPRTAPPAPYRASTSHPEGAFEIHLARETLDYGVSPNMPLLAETRPVLSLCPTRPLYAKRVGQSSAIRQAEYASQLGSKILSFYETILECVLPCIPKMDMVAVPDFGGKGMENWGLITFKAVLYYPARDLRKEGQGELVERRGPRWRTVVSANLVTPQVVGRPLAQRGGHRGRNGKIHHRKTPKNIFETDSLESSQPYSSCQLTTPRLSEIFDGSSTAKVAKGATLSFCLQLYICEKLHYLRNLGFNPIWISSYLNAFAYSNAEQDDLWEHLTAAAHRDRKLPENLTVKTIMDTWTLQKGFPVIKVTRSSDGTSADVSQVCISTGTFLLVKEEKSCRTQDLRWWVPLSYTSQGEANFDQTEAVGWMKDSDQRIALTSLPPKDQWVIFNLQQTGYYRVNYDDHNWNLLVQQLKDDHEVIHVVNRAQIIDDAMNLARAGQLSYTTALDVFTYLGKEREHLPWMSGVSNLNYVMLMFKRTHAFPALKRYILDLILPALVSNCLGGSSRDRRSEGVYKTIAGLACRLGHPDCRNEALHRTIISPNLRSELMCTGVKAGGEKEWNFVWNEYLNSNASQEKISFLASLGCSRNVTILSR
ncbi:LOW QUALITY PROTEIN: aminopeptidase N-like [Penaeus monodon]|uniref:LOW QUALITY PROTEIN: aminopeptidase N-like n=1 Tax=Penaeus monodon TaxID=6687 RepID=UPI0018A7DE9F|nr:LOW QUALITY PROTEIN: aminopeptidase N-like [Penaeus monodon]